VRVPTCCDAGDGQVRLLDPRLVEGDVLADLAPLRGDLLGLRRCAFGGCGAERLHLGLERRDLGFGLGLDLARLRFDLRQVLLDRLGARLGQAGTGDLLGAEIEGLVPLFDDLAERALDLLRRGRGGRGEPCG
jgi:hypothetical protein